MTLSNEDYVNVARHCGAFGANIVDNIESVLFSSI